MRLLKLTGLLLILIANFFSSCHQKGGNSETVVYSGNPVISGWYADPEGIIFNDEYWIYPTYSDDYEYPDRSTEFSEHQLEVQKNTINEQYL